MPETAWKVLTKLPTLLSSLLPSDAAANADKNQMLKTVNIDIVSQHICKSNDQRTDTKKPEPALEKIFSIGLKKLPSGGRWYVPKCV